ncbi:MAG: EamA family transporter [Streptosporangiales bacterium]|nr:EamA family transporter [Streptosporangiales bacterium]
MRVESSATPTPPIPSSGTLLALLGTLVFSLTLPTTALALASFTPYQVGIGRAGFAALLAALVLLAERPPRPRGRQWGSLLVVAGGVVFGFPLLTTFALDQGATPAYAAVFIGLLPAATAVAGALRAGDRPRPAFWVACGAGVLAVTLFTLTRGAGGPGPGLPDLLLLLALAACALGYAEGARLGRELPPRHVICWALVLVAPLTAPLTVVLFAVTPPRLTPAALAGFAYVSAGSMFLGFFAWYAGLARVGVARGGQLQLLQPVLTVGWAALLNGEAIAPVTVLTALAVLVCVGLTQRAGRPLASTVPADPPCDGRTHDPSVTVISAAPPVPRKQE